MKTRTPKVAPLKVPLNVLRIWRLCYLRGCQKKVPNMALMLRTLEDVKMVPKTPGYNNGPRVEATPKA